MTGSGRGCGTSPAATAAATRSMSDLPRYRRRSDGVYCRIGGMSMERMEVPEPLEVDVPFIRDWLTPAFRRWNRMVYGRRGWFIAWGWLFWVMLVVVAVKAAIFWSVVVVMCAAFLVTGITDAFTYRHRLKVATIEAATEEARAEAPPHAA